MRRPKGAKTRTVETRRKRMAMEGIRGDEPSGNGRLRMGSVGESLGTGRGLIRCRSPCRARLEMMVALVITVRLRGYYRKAVRSGRNWREGSEML